MTELAYQTIGGAVHLLTKDGALCTTCCEGPYVLGSLTSFRDFGNHRAAYTTTPTNFRADGLATPGNYWRVAQWGYNTYPGNNFWWAHRWTEQGIWQPKEEHLLEGIVGVNGNLTGLTNEAWSLNYHLTDPAWIMYSVDVQISRDGVIWPPHP